MILKYIVEGGASTVGRAGFPDIFPADLPRLKDTLIFADQKTGDLYRFCSA